MDTSRHNPCSSRYLIIQISERAGIEAHKMVRRNELSDLRSKPTKRFVNGKLLHDSSNIQVSVDGVLHPYMVDGKRFDHNDRNLKPDHFMVNVLKTIGELEREGLVSDIKNCGSAKVSEGGGWTSTVEVYSLKYNNKTVFFHYD